MGKNSWSESDLKAKGFTVQGNKAVKLVGLGVETINTGGFNFGSDIGKNKGALFIPRNVPSSKNSRRLVVKDGKPKSYESKLCERYRKETKTWYIQLRDLFIRTVQQKGLQKPLRIQFYFVRTSKLRFDHHNAVQLVMDLMTEHGWIPDDNADEAVAVPPEGQVYHVDKKNAGVYIIV